MKNTELIDGYLQKRLTKEQEASFSSSLENDAEFSKEFQELKEIQLGVRSHSRLEIMSFLNEIEQDLQEEESTLNRNTMKKMISVAASVVLIATISFFALRQDQAPSLNEIYAENFTHYENINGQVRGASAELETLENQAFNAYDMGNYSLAAASFAELVKSEKNATNYFYMGLSNLEAGNVGEAINNLNATFSNFDNAFDKQAKWYLSLAHLANEDEESAVANLVGLTLEESAYKAKAEAILKEMGLTTSSLDNGEAGQVNTRPRTDGPSGVMEDFEGQRRWQFGVVTSYSNGYNYRFVSEGIMDGLVEGAEVEMIILRANKKRKSGFAYILGVN